jgi:hypothetical protein
MVASRCRKLLSVEDVIMEHVLLPSVAARGIAPRLIGGPG